MVEELRKLEVCYRLLVENANDADYALDAELRITDVNPYAGWIIDYPRDESIGRPFPGLGILAPPSLGSTAKDAARTVCLRCA